MTRREANLVTALALVLAGLGLAFTAPRWARFLREPVSAFGDDAPAGATAGAVRADGDEEVLRTISVKLYFPAAESGGLLSEAREVASSSDLSRQIKSVVEELVKGPRTGLLPAFSAQTRVLEVFVTARGVAHVDLSKDASSLPGVGSEGELLSVYSLVNSVTANFPSVKQVQLLVDDRPATTLGGHVDVSRPLVPDLTFLLTPSPLASPSPEAAPALPPGP